MDLHIDTTVDLSKPIHDELLRWQGGQRGEPGYRLDLSENNIAAFTSAMLTQGCTVAALAGADHSARMVTDAVANAQADVARELSSVRQLLRELLHGDDAVVPARLREILRVEGSRIEHNFDPARKDGPLHVLHTQLADLTAAVARDQGRREADAKGARKGFDFEESVVDALTTVATGLGGECVPTGTTVGAVPDSKKGDAVLTLPNGARIAVEASDALRRDWSRYLTETERNRETDTSLAVVRTRDQNAGTLLRMIGARRTAVAFDPDTDDVDVLRAAITVLSALPHVKCSETADLSAARAAVEQVSGALDRCGEMARTAASLRKQAAKMESLVSELREESQRSISEALGALG